jgi:hypothetical protein
MQNTTPKPFVFILMPFAEEFNDVYKLGIKPACISAGAYCERVDEQIFQESILDRVYNQIAKADLIISEMTGRNPNVFYETGYAHALGKKVILLTQKSDDIPFDLQHYPHIIYSGKISLLKEELERRVSWYISQPSEAVFDPLSQLKIFTNGQEIISGAQVQIPHSDYRKYDETWVIFFNLAVNNAGNRLVDASNISISLILPSIAQIPEQSFGTLLRLPDGRMMAGRESLRQLFPQEWYSGEIMNIQFPIDILRDSQSIDLVLRMFTPSGVFDIPFRLQLESIQK